MRKATFLTLSTAAIAVMLTAPPMRAERPDFTGSWHLDVPSSSIGMTPAPTSGTLTIEKRHKILHFAEAMALPQGNESKEFDWKTDDQYHPINGPGSGEVVAHWKGATLMGDRRSGDGAEIESITWNMRDTNTLVETVHRAGQPESTLIWRH